MPPSDVNHRSWSHAGGVAYRIAEDRYEVLLVRASQEPHDWVLPKGHIEPGETPEDCARREIREEAGVDAEAIAFLGDDAYTTADQGVVVAFFLMRYREDVAAQEDRERGWFTFVDALHLIPFPGSRAIIRAAEAHLAGHLSHNDV
jgi:ADP-ribose pyrophosphatase YjhB (NUDIX family)